MKFVANKLLYPGKSIDFQDETSLRHRRLQWNYSASLLLSPFLLRAIL